ncbi:MAG: hypothetical protein GW778_03155 [Alphaproteobacteria bacterium]|nr:hypothetical protein [Alphaproteobacteria bacterium]
MLDKLHKPFLIGLISLVCAVAAIIIAKIWGFDLPEDLFFKILATLGVLIVLFGFLMVVNSDFGEHKKLKDEHYID